MTVTVVVASKEQTGKGSGSCVVFVYTMLYAYYIALFKMNALNRRTIVTGMEYKYPRPLLTGTESSVLMAWGLWSRPICPS